MSLKLGAIADWQRVDKGNSLALPGTKYRKIRIEVMTYIQTSLLLWTDGGKSAFPLGKVDGHQVIEFWFDGDVNIDADANVYYKSSDGQPTHVVLPDAVTFTKIATRRARNYQQELMEHLMWQNSNKRIAKLEAEFRRKMEKLGADPETGEIVDVEKPKKRPKRPNSEQESPDAGNSGDEPEGDKAGGDESANRAKGVGKPPASADG